MGEKREKKRGEMGCTKEVDLIIQHEVDETAAVVEADGAHLPHEYVSLMRS